MAWGWYYLRGWGRGEMSAFLEGLCLDFIERNLDLANLKR